MSIKERLRWTSAAHGPAFSVRKNFLAVNMFILYVCALALALDRSTAAWVRLAAGFARVPVRLFS